MSYSRRDKAVMRRITAFLRKQGINVWVDNEKLVPGTPIWEVEIEKAIKSASAIIVILSPDSKNSEWVRREISLADQYRTRIFPVLVRGDEESSITIRLITRQYIDIRQNEDTGLDSLAFELSRYKKELETREKVDLKSAEKATKKKVERKTAKEVAREKVEDNAETLSYNKVGAPKPAETSKLPFLFSWLGRVLIGSTFGTIVSITAYIVAGDYVDLRIDLPILIGACGLAGLLTYPHKSSIILLVLGFIVTGFFIVNHLLSPPNPSPSPFAAFMIYGSLLGVPGGALISRINFWLKPFWNSHISFWLKQLFNQFWSKFTKLFY
jgi:hypothetical protein